MYFFPSLKISEFTVAVSGKPCIEITPDLHMLLKHTVTG